MRCAWTRSQLLRFFKQFGKKYILFIRILKGWVFSRGLKFWTQKPRKNCIDWRLHRILDGPLVVQAIHYKKQPWKLGVREKVALLGPSFFSLMGASSEGVFWRVASIAIRIGGQQASRGSRKHDRHESKSRPSRPWHLQRGHHP